MTNSLGVEELPGDSAYPHGRKRVLLFADDMSEEGGIRTRILGELSVAASYVDLVVIAKIRARNIHRIGGLRTAIDSRRKGIEIWLVPTLPHGGVRIAREVVTLFNILLLALVGFLAIVRSRPSSFYSHNVDCSAAALLLGKLLKVPVTADLHGDEAEENIVLCGWKRDGFRFRYWHRLLERIVLNSKTVVCVSHAHKSFLESTYGREGRTIVIPCCVEAGKVRDQETEMGVSECIPSRNQKGIVLFYAGSASKWQMIDKIAEFYVAVRKTIPGVSLLMLISEKRLLDKVKGCFPPSCRPNVSVYSVSHEQVARMAAGADIALLFRLDMTMNRIASPTKFAEYLMAGLPLLITPHVGDYSDLVESEHLGKVVDVSRISNADYACAVVKEVLLDSSIKARCIDYATRNLTWQSYSEQVRCAFISDQAQDQVGNL